MSLRALETNELPPAPPLKKIIGPSFIILALGLGSGEVILWPYLTSHFGMGVIWGALVGLTFQFFMNMEIERYTLAHGESVFVGFTRKWRFIPVWFILSTFLPWVWPGIIASSAQLFGHVFGLQNSNILAICLLVVIGLILSLGPILYKTVEKMQQTIITIGVPSIFILSIVLAKPMDWMAVSKGIFGIGPNYLFIPEGMAIATFLSALAYAGAGGNLNLAQSFYIKERGYGMGKFAGRITSILTGKNENVSITGTKFEPTAENVSKFKTWWKNINIEHFIIFWFTGAITIVLLGLLAYATTYGLNVNASGIDFVFAEAAEIGNRLIPAAGIFFLIVAGSTLFGTQLGVFDATSRILSENIVLLAPNKIKERNIRYFYYIVLWLQIVTAISIFAFGFTQPLQLLTIAAVLNAIAMFIHVGLTLRLNLSSLAQKIKPSLFRVTAMSLGFLFYGSFSIYVIVTEGPKLLLTLISK